MNKLPSYGFLVLLAALFALGSYFVNLRNERAKKSWPSVPGTITEDATVVQATKANLETPTVTVTTRDDRHYEYLKVWALRVKYEYEVAGQQYTGRRATATDHVDAISDYPNGPSPEMVEWSGQLTKGSRVSVHYNPNDTSDSYILYTESPALRSVLITGVVLMVLGMALVAAPRMFR